ncbi:hypothetical protein CYLTODRAFT_445074 [Cylindrobasidium torrendii FP15055 ss-10]|uniref:Zn(2)-C6 fungal-type domain-containing protein n=1 Tax=Cylindrobasidium torrendii FP15055 ss-10 TaxID=1314674 RepID=A0A0D7B6N0_9AGAR|nr:hypothetical protein CYLTODRAFT_445074 [Cylindrobasidium torrendii FP15055 ss-10]
MDPKPKRKRLAKACDGCHKSKRRCDGTDPCSNCYFASKPCTYTDSTGRPVQAPRFPESSRTASPGPSTTSYANPQPQSPYPPSGSSSTTRKRARLDADPESPEPPIVRELTSLFFANALPMAAIIHKPTFKADLANNQIPTALLHAVCAAGAPFSKQPTLLREPARCQGRPFAEAAARILFDSTGRFVGQATLHSAQALCLLHWYSAISQTEVGYDKAAKDKSHPGFVDGDRFRVVAIQIIQALNVHQPEHPLLTPVPSHGMVQESIERECLRRIFWLVYVVDCYRSVYWGWDGLGMNHIRSNSKSPAIDGGAIGYSEAELRLRLPVDETSFELAQVHQSLPEYLFLPAVRTHYASEMGHLVRIITIHQKLEWALDKLNDTKARNTIAECGKMIDEWLASLPTHLSFSPEYIAVHKAMFATGSNMSAWCYGAIHIGYASSSLALIVGRQRLAEQERQSFHVPDMGFIFDRVYAVNDMFVGRDKQPTILGMTVWPLVKYLNLQDSPDVKVWIQELFETAGTRFDELVYDRWGDANGMSRLAVRPSTPPPTMPPYPPSSTSAPPSNNASRRPSQSATVYAPNMHIDENRLLPSLKACGLLDWRTSPSSPSSGLPPQGQGQGQGRPNPSAASASPNDTATRGLPMGLSWLADDR